MEAHKSESTPVSDFLTDVRNVIAITNEALKINEQASRAIAELKKELCKKEKPVGASEVRMYLSKTYNQPITSQAFSSIKKKGFNLGHYVEGLGELFYLSDVEKWVKSHPRKSELKRLQNVAA
jgi:hypothetical protein